MTAPPEIVAQAISASGGLKDAASARMVLRTKTSASGIVTVPAATLLGGLPVALAGAGVTVRVVAVGP